MYDFNKPEDAYKVSRLCNRGGVTADFPPYVTFELIDDCNFTCRMCHVSYRRKSKTEMEFGLFQKCLDDIAKYGSLVRFIGYCEPFMYSKIRDAITNVKKKKLQLHITTNGSLLDRPMIDFILASKIDCVIFSFQGFTAEEFCFMRKVSRAVYNKVTDNIRSLFEMRVSDKPFIRVTTTITDRDDPADRHGFVERHSKYADEVQVTGTTHFVTLETLFSVRNIMKQSNVKAPKKAAAARCFIPNYEMKISENGDVYICCSAITDDLLIGNAREDSLYNLWHSEKSVNIRKTLSDGHLERFRECSACSARYEYEDTGNALTDTVSGNVDKYGKAIMKTA